MLIVIEELLPEVATLKGVEMMLSQNNLKQSLDSSDFCLLDHLSGWLNQPNQRLDSYWLAYGRGKKKKNKRKKK